MGKLRNRHVNAALPTAAVSCTIADVEASGIWPRKVTTELSPVGDFREAEPEHQDYLERFPTGYTCHFVRPGWKLLRRVVG
jgi:peptide-methionine (S)-S-oxide reductase